MKLELFTPIIVIIGLAFAILPSLISTAEAEEWDATFRGSGKGSGFHSEIDAYSADYSYDGKLYFDLMADGTIKGRGDGTISVKVQSKSTEFDCQGEGSTSISHKIGGEWDKSSDTASLTIFDVLPDKIPLDVTCFVFGQRSKYPVNYEEPLNFRDQKIVIERFAGAINSGTLKIYLPGGEGQFEWRTNVITAGSNQVQEKESDETEWEEDESDENGTEEEPTDEWEEEEMKSESSIIPDLRKIGKYDVNFFDPRLKWTHNTKDDFIDEFAIIGKGVSIMKKGGIFKPMTEKDQIEEGDRIKVFKDSKLLLRIEGGGKLVIGPSEEFHVEKDTDGFVVKSIKGTWRCFEEKGLKSFDRIYGCKMRTPSGGGGAVRGSDVIYDYDSASDTAKIYLREGIYLLYQESGETQEFEADQVITTNYDLFDAEPLTQEIWDNKVAELLVTEEDILNQLSDENEIILELDNDSFSIGETVTINGRVDGVSDLTLATEVKDSGNNTILTRTVQTDLDGSFQLTYKIPSNANTGTYQVVATATVNGQNIQGTTQFTVSSDQSISITSIQATDQQGNTVSEFKRGTNGFVKVVLSSDSSISSLATVNLFGSDLTTLGIGSLKTTLPTGQSEIVLSFFIPSDASTGMADIYANVFSNWPSQGGIPLSHELSAQVRIE